jgi:hypothetical protein
LKTLQKLRGLAGGDPIWLQCRRRAPLRSGHKPDACLIAILCPNFSRENSIDCPISSHIVSKSSRTVLKIDFTMQVDDLKQSIFNRNRP